MSKSHFTIRAGAALATMLLLSPAAFAADTAATAATPAEVATEAVQPAPAAQPVAETAAQATPAEQAAPAAEVEAAPQKQAATPAAAPAAGTLKAAEFALGATVFGADGKDVGKIIRISSAANGAVTELQVDTGKSGVVVVPANVIATGGTKIKLQLTSDEVSKLAASGKNG